MGKKLNNKAAFIEAYITNPPLAAEIAARNYSRYITFTEPLRGVGKGLSNLKNRSIVVLWLMPLVRTLWNILRAGGRRTPILGMMAFEVGHSGTRWTWVRRLKAPGRERSKAVVEQLTGVALFFVISELVKRGVLTGPGPDDEGKRRAWLTTYQPYSVNVRGHWRSYENTADAYAMPMAAAASFWESVGAGTVEGIPKSQEGRVAEVLWKVTSGLGKSILDRTMLQNLNRAMQAFTDPTRGSQFLARQTTLPVPNILRWISRTSAENVPRGRGVLDAWKKSLPWAIDSVAPIRDMYGQPILKAPTHPNYRTGDPEHDRRKQFAAEFIRLGMAASSPPRTILSGVELENGEYDSWIRFSGAKRWMAHRAVMGSPKYWKLGDQARRYVIKQAQGQLALGQQEFAMLQAKAGNTRIVREWVRIRKNLGLPAAPGWANEYIN